MLIKSMAALSKREKGVFYLCAAIIACALLYNFIFEPIAKKWLKANKEIQIKRMSLMKNIRAVKNRKKVFSEYELYADKVKQKGSDEKEIAQIFREIESAARNNHVRILNMKPVSFIDTSGEKEGYKKLAVEVECEAEMSSLVQFIYNIQTCSQILKVEQIKLKAKEMNSNIIGSTLSIGKILILS
ncbi:type 4a pilus biogenesis protein PilO [bacterium]|nr:type 4a pilus biogenesis protein PilO [bacterium]